MANLSAVIKQLRSERERTARELERLDNAIAALNHVGTRATTGRARGRRAGRKFSAAARARMAAAQRARWAKRKGKKQKAA